MRERERNRREQYPRLTFRTSIKWKCFRKRNKERKEMKRKEEKKSFKERKAHDMLTSNRRN